MLECIVGSVELSHTKHKIAFQNRTRDNSKIPGHCLRRQTCFLNDQSTATSILGVGVRALSYAIPRYQKK
jgi:hypothetical protein